jgi:hypothetical protein
LVRSEGPSAGGRRGPDAAVLRWLLAGLIAAATPARADWRPQGYELTAGHTAWISSLDSTEGGFAGSASALYDLSSNLRTGIMAFADDLGAALTTLYDANDPSVSLGPTESQHAAVFGVAWRADAAWLARDTWAPYVSGSWGYYRINVDELGVQTRASSALGFSLAGGVQPFGPRSGPGLFARYHRIFDDRTGRYLTVGLDWQWRPPGGP